VQDDRALAGEQAVYQFEIGMDVRGTMVSVHEYEVKGPPAFLTFRRTALCDGRPRSRTRMQQDEDGPPTVLSALRRSNPDSSVVLYLRRRATSTWCAHASDVPSPMEQKGECARRGRSGSTETNRASGGLADAMTAALRPTNVPTSSKRRGRIRSISATSMAASSEERHTSSIRSFRTPIVIKQWRADSQEAGTRLSTFEVTQQGVARSLPDTPNGDCHLLLALGLTVESLPVLAEVVIRGAARIVVRCRPVKPVRL
jgi:hypothetical protein